MGERGGRRRIGVGKRERSQFCFCFSTLARPRHARKKNPKTKKEREIFQKHTMFPIEILVESLRRVSIPPTVVLPV